MENNFYSFYFTDNIIDAKNYDQPFQKKGRDMYGAFDINLNKIKEVSSWDFYSILFITNFLNNYIIKSYLLSDIF